MSIWNLHIGWFVLIAFAVLALVIIGMEWVCWRQKRDVYITKVMDDDEVELFINKIAKGHLYGHCAEDVAKKLLAGEHPFDMREKSYGK